MTTAPHPINKRKADVAVRAGCRYRDRMYGYPRPRSHRVCRLILEAWYIEHIVLESPNLVLSAALMSGEEPNTLDEARAFLLEYDYRHRDHEEGTDLSPQSIAQWAAAWSYSGR